MARARAFSTTVFVTPMRDEQIERHTRHKPCFIQTQIKSNRVIKREATRSSPRTQSLPHHLAPQQLEASHTNGVLACAHRQHKTPSKAKPNVDTARLILTCEHHVGAGSCAGTRPSPVALCCANRRIRSRTIEGAAGAALARDDAEVRELELEVQRRGASPGTTTRDVRPRGGALGISWYELKQYFRFASCQHTQLIGELSQERLSLA